MRAKAEYTFISGWAKRFRAVARLGHRCQDCSTTNAFVMDFHHPEDNKEEIVGNLRRLRWSEYIKEVDKCILLCSNCHAIRHFHVSETRSTEIKKKLLELKESYCSRCRFAKIAALGFHHLENKKFNIGNFSARRSSLDWADVLLELDKCEVICRNCHRLEHLQFERICLLQQPIEEAIRKAYELPKPVDKNTIFKLHDEGLTQSKIAKTLSCAKSTVSTIIKNGRPTGLVLGRVC